MQVYMGPGLVGERERWVKAPRRPTVCFTPPHKLRRQPLSGNSVRLQLPTTSLSPQHTSKGAIIAPNNRLLMSVSFGLLHCLQIITSACPGSLQCEPWRDMTPHCASTGPQLEAARSPGLEGTYPSWSNPEMWHNKLAMTVKGCDERAMLKSTRQFKVNAINARLLEACNTL